jgi:hypothetical protein
VNTDKWRYEFDKDRWFSSRYHGKYENFSLIEKPQIMQEIKLNGGVVSIDWERIAIWCRDKFGKLPLILTQGDYLGIVLPTDEDALMFRLKFSELFSI